MPIRIDRDLCIGSGVCVMYAPATFANDAETKVVVVDPAGDPPDLIATAVEGCPTGALTLVSEGAES